MNIHLKIIGIIISLIVWFLLDVLFVYNFSKLDGAWCGNPQQRSIALTGLLWTALGNFSLVLVLFSLKFKFWYICLIISCFSIIFVKIFLDIIYKISELIEKITKRR